MFKELMKLEYIQLILFVILGYFIGYLMKYFNILNGFSVGGVESGLGGIQPPFLTTSDRAVGAIDPGPPPGPPPPPPGPPPPPPPPGPTPGSNGSNVSCSKTGDDNYCCTHKGYFDSDTCTKNASSVERSECPDSLDCRGLWHPAKGLALVYYIGGLLLLILIGYGISKIKGNGSPSGN